MSIPAPAIKEIRTTMEAIPEAGMSLDELVRVMAKVGNKILRVDRKNNLLVLLDVRDRIRGDA